MKKWILSLSVLCLSSIAFADDRLKVEVGPSKAHILPISLQSCVNEVLGHEITPDVPAPSVEFPHVRLTWFGSGKFRLISVRLKLKSEALENGSYQCRHKESELAAIFGNRIAIDPETPQKNQCAIRCGNIQLRPGAEPTEIKGTLEVLGSELTMDGVRPVYTEVPVSVQSY